MFQEKRESDVSTQARLPTHACTPGEGKLSASGTYGLEDFHCQNWNGRATSNVASLPAPANGTAASPPLDEGGGRWSKAILRRTTWMKTMTKD